MDTETIVIAAEIFAFCLCAWLVYSRRKSARAKREEKEKYAVWDEAYKKAVSAGKTEYYALMDAVKAVNGSPAIFKVWEAAYNKAINSGVRKYRAGLLATAAARKAAHS